MVVAMLGHKRIPSREGGVEIVVEELSTRMAALGHDVTCYNRAGHHVSGAEFDAERMKLYKGVRLKTVPTVDKKGLAAVSSSFFAALAASFSKAQVVHIHAEGPAFMSWMPKLFGKKVIVTVHGLNWQCKKWENSFGSKYILAGEKMAVRFADEIIVLNRQTQEYFLDTYGRKTLWIPNGVSRPEYKAPDLVKDRFRLDQDGYILFLGRIVPEKGLDHLIEAFRSVKTDLKLVIAGGSSDSDAYMQELKSLAQADPRIIFTGFVQGQMLEELYSNAYIYVLPSLTEGMPLSLLEAMSYGNCCLVSDIPGCTEVVGNEAEIFQAGNTLSLEESLRKLCDDPQLVAGYRRNAQDYICTKYDWDRVTEETLEVYSGGK